MEVTGIAGVSIIFTLEVQETSTITKCWGLLHVTGLNQTAQVPCSTPCTLQSV